jgi:hypothetical protein
MIVGSVLPTTLRRQAEGNGAHRTAGPDHESGSSDPMYPKPLDALLSDTLRPQRAKCITRPFPQNIGCRLVIFGLLWKPILILSKPDDARRALTRTK